MNLNEIIANIVIPAAIAGILTPIIMKGILKHHGDRKYSNIKTMHQNRKIKKRRGLATIYRTRHDIYTANRCTATNV